METGEPVTRELIRLADEMAAATNKASRELRRAAFIAALDRLLIEVEYKGFQLGFHAAPPTQAAEESDEMQELRESGAGGAILAMQQQMEQHARNVGKTGNTSNNPAEPVIIVGGSTGCGKSAVMEIIYKALRDAGLHPYSDDLAHERRMVDEQPPPAAKVWRLIEKNVTHPTQAPDEQIAQPVRPPGKSWLQPPVTAVAMSNGQIARAPDERAEKESYLQWAVDNLPGATVTEFAAGSLAWRARAALAAKGPK